MQVKQSKAISRNEGFTTITKRSGFHIHCLLFMLSLRSVDTDEADEEKGNSPDTDIFLGGKAREREYVCAGKLRRKYDRRAYILLPNQPDCKTKKNDC